MTLASRALRALRTHRMVAPGGRVLVALSGGPDSVALLHILRELEARGELVVAGVAHLNHRLRARASEADEQFCRALAHDLGLSAEIGSEDVRALAKAQHRSIEDAARTARYAFLEAAADRAHAEAIAVGHTLDDQAETFLLRLLRGAGPRGLGGIRPRVGRVIRPLIEISRAELHAYVADRRLAFRTDETNADVTIPRNRVRHELIPLLKAFSPAVVEVLAREADIAREDEDFLSRAAIDLAPRIVLLTKRGIEVDVEGVRVLHPALASRLVREALHRAAPEQFFGRDHVQAVLALVNDVNDVNDAAREGAAVSLPGLTARRAGGRLVLDTGGAAAAAQPFANSFRFPLSIPGEVDLSGWTVSAHAAAGGRVAAAVASSDGSADSIAAVVATAALKLPLAVRSRRRGDRFRPLGMRGRGRKLQDFLVDRKVARNERDTLPLVVDSDDRIVWVVGHSVAEDFRVTAPFTRRDTLESKAVRRRRLNSTLRSLLFWMVLVVVGVLIWQFSNTFQRGPQPIAFSTFLNHLEKGQVLAVTMTGNEVTGELSAETGNGKVQFRTYVPGTTYSTHYQGLANKLLEKNIDVTAKPESTSPWTSLLYAWAPILLMIGFWIFIMRQMQSGGNKALSFGKSRAKLSSSSQKKVTFKDVVGRRRGQGRASGNHRVPEGTAEVPETGRPHPEGRAADGPSGNRQDASRPRRRRRSQRAVFLDQRLRFRRDVRRRWRVPRPRPVRTGEEERALHRVHRRD